MRARIYQPARNAMQSGPARSHQWILEFAPAAHLASIEAQTIVAVRIRDSQGGTYRAWPGCRAKLGLP